MVTTKERPSRRTTRNMWALRIIPSAVLAVAMTVVTMPVYARPGPSPASAITVQGLLDRMDEDYWALKTLLLTQQVDSAIDAGTIAGFDKWGALTDAATHATHHQQLWTYDQSNGHMLLLIAYDKVHDAQIEKPQLQAIIGSYGTVTIQPYDPGAFNSPADGGFWEWLKDVATVVVDAVVAWWNNASPLTKVVVVVNLVTGDLVGAAVSAATAPATDMATDLIQDAVGLD